MTTRTKKAFGGTPGDRLRLIRRELNLSREEIERRFGLSAETLKAWENGKVGLTEKGLKRCITVFREMGILVGREWVMAGEGLDPRLSRGIEHLFKNPDEVPTDTPLPDDLELLLKEVEFFKSSTPNATVLLVTSEEMLPKYAPGDYVAGRFKPASEAQSASGKDCIIMTKYGDKLFRRFIAETIVTEALVNEERGINIPGKECYRLVAHNPLWGRTLEPVLLLPVEDLEKIAPVVWHRRPEN